MSSRIDGVYSPRLLSIDPGLDVTGWSCFRKGLWASTPVVALARLEKWGEITTSPRSAFQDRLVAIHEGVKAAVAESEAKEVAVEVPSKAGEYRGAGKARSGGLQNLERAIGVIIMTASLVVGSANVRLIRAPSGQWAKKPFRHQWLRHVAKEAKMALPQGPKGGAMEDVLDSVWNGIQVLRTPPIITN